MTVRFDLTDARERALAEYIQTLDLKKYISRNRFMLDALAEYIDYISYDREQHLEDIRNIMREEMRACFAAANYPTNSVKPASALSAEQQRETERDILDDLRMFD